MKYICKVLTLLSILLVSLAGFFRFGIDGLRNQVLKFLLRRELILHRADSNAASIGIIGGADGPTAIFLATPYRRDWNETTAMILGIASALAGVAALLCGLLTDRRE